MREKQDNDFQGEHQMRDHPRVCGKNNFCITHYQSSRGSPPRVREKLQDTTQPSGLGGITPACAGKTSCPAENIEIRPGSPPRVREKPEESDLFADNTGITPACAGKTSTVPMTKEGLRDHPRVCGKNLGALRLALVVSGSPPRVREKRLCVGGH